MAPDRSVLVKRKAEDEPLEMLIVDDATQQTATRRKRRLRFRLVPDVTSPKTALPVASKEDKPSQGGQSKPSALVSDGQRSVPPAAHASPKRASGPPPAARRFHMLKERLASESAGFQSGIGMKRKTGTAQLVVFEEERAKKQRPDLGLLKRAVTDQAAPLTGSLYESNASLAPSTARRARKRPNASPAERLWRQASWSNLPSRSRSRDVSPWPQEHARGQSEQRPGVSEIASLELAVELQALSMEQTARDERRAAEAEAAARQASLANSQSALDADSDDENYVYDRYVRCASPSSDIGTHDDMSESVTDAGALGFLVIGMENEAAWTAYLDDMDDEEETDDPVLEDDDDSNAEDYYTNDYPDEEQSVSDEDDALENLSNRSSSLDSKTFDEDFNSEDEGGWVIDR